MAEPTFLHHFGPAPRCHVCTIAMEPNPIHFHRLSRLESGFRSAGLGVLFLPVAASDADGFTEFYIDVTNRTSRKGDMIDLGASVSPLKAVHQLAQYGESSNATRVRTVDLSRVILHAHHRLAALHRTPAPSVVMKLDTEFLEFRVLPHLTWTLALCASVDSVMVDWSNHALEQSSSRRPAFTQPAVHVAYAMRDAFMQAFRPTRRGRHCRSTLLDLDDETYMTGGLRFPMAPATDVCTPRASPSLPAERRPRMGYCAFVPRVLPADRAGACDAAETKGAVRLRTMDECIRHCERCAPCQYVSFSRPQAECGWFSSCDFDRLQLRDGTNFRTVPVPKKAR